MGDELLTPSKISAWLECAHSLTLKRQVEARVLAEPPGSFGSFARLLVEKGRQHEADCLADYQARGLRVLSIPDRDTKERFADWVRRVGPPRDGAHDVIYQQPLLHDGIRGIADFLVRAEDGPGWEPVDAKLARAEAKPGHVLQLCFYADAIEAATGVRPRRMHLWLGSGRVETLTVDEFAPYWRRLRSQLAAALAADPTAVETVPEPCGHCEFCEFFDVCTDRWRAEDALHYVAGIRTQDRELLQVAGISGLASLAEVDDAVAGIRPERLTRLVGQATLQAKGRLAEDSSPPYELIEPGEDPLWGRGLEQLPEPDDGDVFLDFEGHPFWRADTGLFFLFGLILRDTDGSWVFRAWWAHDLAEEAAATASLVDFLAERAATHPRMHIYHYNHTERSAMERLVVTHATREVQLRSLVSHGRFIDLLAVARNTMQVGTESYSLKALERLTTFERSHEIEQGAGAVLSYERWMSSHERGDLTAIAAYNEDDVRATMALRDWLIEHRPPETPWRASEILVEEERPELDEQVAALHAYGAGTPEHLLGDVLGYWRREWLAQLAPQLAKAQQDTADLIDRPDVLAGLSPNAPAQRQPGRGGTENLIQDFSFPPQNTAKFRGNDRCVYSTSEGGPRYTAAELIDVEKGLATLKRPADSADEQNPPQVVARLDWQPARPKPETVSAFAARVLDSSAEEINPGSLALLGAASPRFFPGSGPVGGCFTDDIGSMDAWVGSLDRSYVAVQGPPGTGKTYRAAHLIRSLLLAGKRVGITAFSHYAIDNVLDELLRVLDEHGGRERLNAVRKVNSKPKGQAPTEVTYVTANPPCGRAQFNVIAGTTWLFANSVMQAAPVDVLLVDEAGQLSLADTLAAASSTRNLILLGDPQQLPQVAQAVHPGGSGASALEHVLGDDVTIRPQRGVFLTETRRMHPDVCDFISEQFYAGRLSSHESCARQTTSAGTGLRWIRAEHSGRTTESPEEAELVAAQIGRLIGTSWTDQRGRTAPLTARDFMVVAPYKDQVDLIRERLDADPMTRGVPVGTVDKFQGRQAAVVLFSMTTSSSLDMVRSSDFLFSRNRLNVAVSRARCLAYLVCTEELLNSRAGNVKDMRLISTLCAFVERARR